MLSFLKKIKNTKDGFLGKRSSAVTSVRSGSVGSSVSDRSRTALKQSFTRRSNTHKFSSKTNARDNSRANPKVINYSWFRHLRLQLSKFNWGIIRIQFVGICFVLFWLILWGRAWQVQVIEGASLADQAAGQHMSSILVTGKRGTIEDRNGQILARSVESRSVYVRPHEVKNVKETAAFLSKVLKKPIDALEKQLAKTSRKFIWIARKVDDNVAMAIQNAKLPGIDLSKEYHRVYPLKQLAGHLLGFVGVDDQGLEGIERSFDKKLASIPTRRIVQRDALGRLFYMQAKGQNEPVGKNIRLTLDSQLQFFAEETIAKTVQEFEANWGGVLVVDVQTGDILAWAQYPYFNPNAFSTYTPSQYRNRMATDALEPGSTLKPFLVAAAIQEGLVNRNTVINCENGRWKTKTITISDTSAHKKLSVSDILRYSSNIGVAKIGQRLGAKSFHNYLTKLGFGIRTIVPVAEHKGIVRNYRQWAEADLLATSFGQSVSVTGLQMVQAYLTLINDGVYKPLRLILNEEQPKIKETRVFRTDVARTVMRILRDVVQEGGSGKKARIEGTLVAGKTGTAQKADKKTGTYGDGRLASFVGFAPADKPRYLTLVMVDEPTKNPYGGIVAAPVFQEVTRMALMYDGQLPDVVFAKNDTKIKRGSNFDKNMRNFKKSKAPQPLFAMNTIHTLNRSTPYNTLPGRLTRATTVVPDVVGKTLRNAVELFARGGIVPLLKGTGQRVIKQSPKAGTAWPKDSKVEYYLQLSEM